MFHGGTLYGFDRGLCYGVIVGHTLVDASSWSASVLMVNPNADEIVLPCFTCVGSLVPVSAVSDARLVRCGPCRLAPAGLQTEQTYVKEMLEGGQIEPSDNQWASPVVLVTKKDGSTRFYVDYRRLTCYGCSPLWIWLVDIGRWPFRRTLSGRQHLLHTKIYSNFG